MRFLTLAITVTSLMLSSIAAHAESGLYLGASLGNAKVGYQDPNTTLHLSDSDAGYKIYTGFKFTFVAVEAGYVDFGLIEKSNASIDLSGFSAFGKLSMGLGPAEIFAKAGGFVWESDYKTAQDTFKSNDFDPAIGLGAAFNLGGVGVRAEYEYFDISDFDTVSMISVGATWWIL